MIFKISLTKEYPLEWIPEDGITKIKSPFFTLFFFKIFF